MPTYRCRRLGGSHGLKVQIATEWKQVVFREKFTFILGSDDNRVREWKSRGEYLIPAFLVHWHTASITGVMIWGGILSDTRLSLILIQGSMSAKRQVCDILQPHTLPFKARL